MPTIFPMEADWSVPFTEEQEFETSIFTSHDGTEQRQGHTEDAARRFTFQVRPWTVREGGLLESLIHLGQSVQWWVPYWRGMRPLGANAAIGATSLSLDTVGAEFEVGQGAMLFRNCFLNEVVEVTSIASGALGVEATTLAWTAAHPRDKVVPVFLGRMSLSVSLNYEFAEGKAAVLTFDIEEPE